MSDSIHKDGPVQVRIEGVQAFMLKLRELTPVLQKKVLRPMMRDAMKIVREDARAHVPVLGRPVLNSAGVPRRLPGVLRKAISVRTSKDDAQDGNVGVFVNVRPLKGNVYRGKGPNRVLVRKSQRSADNPKDPYYWRWIEFGTAQRTSVRSKKVKDDKGGTRWIASGRGANRGAVRPYLFLHSAADRLGAAAKDLQKRMSDWLARADATGRID